MRVWRFGLTLIIMALSWSFGVAIAQANGVNAKPIDAPAKECVHSGKALQGGKVPDSAPNCLSLQCSGVLMQGGLIACKGRANEPMTLTGRVNRTVVTDAEGWAMFGLYANEVYEVSVQTPSSTPISFVIRPRHDPSRPLKMNCDQIQARTPEQQKKARDGQARFNAAWKLFYPSNAALSGFIMPTEGRISSPHGVQRRYHGVSKITGKTCEKYSRHSGYDIAAPTGTPVIAPAGGTVIMADTDQYYTGQTIAIDHGFGLTSRLIHLSKIDVQVGDKVEQGDKVGEVGSTGRSTGPHLDWGMKWRNVSAENRHGDFYIDPALVLDWQGVNFGANPPPVPSMKTS